ncbi:MAG: 2,3-diphosphoglycerate synthetase [Gaiellaceae bacterium]
MRAVAVIDGEHYADVVREALADLPYDVVAAVVVGGTEKLRGGESYGVPLAPTLEAAIADYGPDVVVDLSDEPVLGPVARFALASRALALGVPYEGADFRFEVPVFAQFDVPSLAVVGTGKRVGKTAVTGHVAQTLARDRAVVVVAMGRGGPAEPELIATPPTLDDLIALSRTGRHAASDHLETAALAGVPTVGCRRAGGGLAGAVFVSNVVEGARTAAALGPDLVVFDGSGAALPPIDVGRRVVVVGAHQPIEVATGYLNDYRLRLADLVVVTMADDGAERLRQAIGRIVRPDVPIVATVLRPRPSRAVEGRRIAYFGTAPAAQRVRLAEHLTAAYGAEVTHVSGALADRARLREELARVVAEVFVVELKAAAIDVVAEVALERGVEVVLASNDVVPLSGGPDLDAELLRLADEAAAQVELVA